MRFVIAILLTVICFSSCYDEKIISVNTPEGEISPYIEFWYEDEWNIQLDLTRKLGEIEEYKKPQLEYFKLLENGQVVADELIYDDEYWFLDYEPTQGKKYQIILKIHDFEEIKSNEQEYIKTPDFSIEELINDNVKVKWSPLDTTAGYRVIYDRLYKNKSYSPLRSSMLEGVNNYVAVNDDELADSIRVDLEVYSSSMKDYLISWSDYIGFIDDGILDPVILNGNLENAIGFFGFRTKAQPITATIEK